MAIGSSHATPPRPLLSRYATCVICAALLTLFGFLSFTAEMGKCATGDEPMHGLASFMVKEHDDYRFNFEDPALWQHWVSLAEPKDALKLDLNEPAFADLLRDWKSPRWRWIVRTLYMTPGNDPDGFLRRERYMLIPLGMVLGALMAYWSWQLAGGTAAVTAAALLAFDPNFLAHSSQIKNDVAITLTACALAYVTWRAGRRLSVWALLALVFVASLPAAVKFSGPLQIIFLGLLLILRALLPAPWLCFGKIRHRWYSKMIVAAGVFCLCSLAAFLTIWASYSFRFTPTSAPDQWEFAPMIRQTAVNAVSARHPDMIGAPIDEVGAWQPDDLVKTITFCNRHRLLPQTWLYGLLYTYQSALVRQTYLCGHLSKVGTWTYFPLAYLFKTPLASQAAVVIGLVAMIVGIVAFLKSRKAAVASGAFDRSWNAACLAIPFAVLFVADIRSRLNLGIRHFLPVYPFLYIMAAIGVAMMIRRLGIKGRAIAVALVIALVAEVGWQFPNYIAFFNVACGGPRGGFWLLGDSNLDWGQDLPALAAWQRRNPDHNLYLCYFGTADPVYYGIRYQPLPGTMTLRDHDLNLQSMPAQRGVIAISATLLQGLNMPRRWQNVYGLLRDNEAPIDVLNGSIYLYDYPPK